MMNAKIIAILLSVYLELISLPQVVKTSEMQKSKPSMNGMNVNDKSKFESGSDSESFSDSKETNNETPEMYSIFIWEIVDGNPVDTELRDYKSFKSNCAYIVIEVLQDYFEMERADDLTEVADDNVFNIYYWIGADSKIADAEIAATKSVNLDLEVNFMVSVHRESEQHESPTFKALFAPKHHDTPENGTSRSPSVKIPEATDKNMKMMFLIRENYMTRFTEVNSSLEHYIKEHDKCVVVNSEKVFIYCGYSTSENLRKWAKNVAENMSATRGLQTKVVAIYGTSGQLSKQETQLMDQLAAEFTPIPETEKIMNGSHHPINGEVVRKKVEQKKEKQEGLPIIRVHSVEKNVTTKDEMVNRENMLVSSFNTDECYIVDISGETGLFVWIGKKSGVEVRETAAKKVEEVLREKSYDNQTPVLYVDERKLNIPPEVDLSDLIALMRNAKLPVSWVLKPDDLFEFQAVTGFTEEVTGSNAALASNEPKIVSICI